MLFCQGGFAFLAKGKVHIENSWLPSSRFAPSFPVVDKLHFWVALARLALPRLRTPAKIAASSSFKATSLTPTILRPTLGQGSKWHPCKPSRCWWPWATEHFKKNWVKVSTGALHRCMMSLYTSASLPVLNWGGAIAAAIPVQQLLWAPPKQFGEQCCPQQIHSRN